VRADRINALPLNFRPTREYRSALIARGYYYRSLDSIPEWERRVAAENLAQEPRLEFAVLEYIATLAYHVAGGEHVWIPRLLSALFWVTGGLFLYATATRIASRDAALIATAFYLFVPFGVTASRAFQRDPMMIMLVLASLFAVARYADRPTLRALIVAGVTAGAAIFVKPIAFFPIFGAYVALVVRKGRLIRAIANPHNVLFAALALLPAIAYTVYGMFIAGFLGEQAERSFLPHVMRYPYFWHGWLEMIGRSTGRVAFAAGLLGAVAFRDSFSRTLAIGLWAGYFLFGLVFNYGIYTHDYYHLMLIPIVALSLSALAEMVLSWLRQPSRPRFLRTAVWAALVALILLAVEPLVWDRADPRFARDVALREEIGDAVNHTTKALILDTAYGKELKYHGSIAGTSWPSRTEIGFQELLGRPTLTAEARLDEKVEQDQCEVFIVVDMAEYRAQGDLRELLNRKYRTLVETEQYTVFDLKEAVGADEGPTEPDE